MSESQPPLILCMDDAAGQEVSLSIEPHDDFQSFLIKAKTLLGFEVDINSITLNQPVLLTDNIYQFLLKAERNLLECPDLAQNFDPMLEPNGDGTDDLVYILDDGTQIKASQIHFDNEDPPVDFIAEKIPFVKYVDDGIDYNEEVRDVSTKMINIIESPVSRWSSKTSSPKKGFVNSLPFKPVSNHTMGFEAQFEKFLETSRAKTFTPLNTVTAKNKSPRSLIKDNYKQFDDICKGDQYTNLTRDEILNMFKDLPLMMPYENNQNFEKRRHVRKTDPSRPGHKCSNVKPMPYVDVDGTLIGQNESQNCFICEKFVDNTMEKLYLFDNEDQRLHRSSPPKKMSTQLKIICEQCLDENFKPSRMKSPNKTLNDDEYLLIRNNQQYIFQKTNPITFKNIRSDLVNSDATSIIDKIEKNILKGSQEKKLDFVKMELGSDGEFKTKTIDNSKGVTIIRDERESSSDVEIVEPEPEIDEVLDNLEEADEELKEFLGMYQRDINVSEDWKCRFCERIFADLQDLIEHGDVHRHDMDDGKVYPCPLCNYGYADFKWLKGHIKAAHDRSNIQNEHIKTQGEELKKESNATTPVESPVAKRTRSSNKKNEQDGKEVQIINSDEVKEEKHIERAVLESVTLEHVIKTEVKQEWLDSSDDEAIWIVQAGDDSAERVQNLLQGNEKIEEAVFKEPKKCDNCRQIVVDESTHKCRKRGRKRKPLGKEEAVICVPSQEDFIKRAHGRPRQVADDGDDVVTRPRKKRTTELTSDPQIVTCHNCNESFTSKVRLKFHMQFHEATSLLSASGQYSCEECSNATFSTETELFDHVHFQHHKQKRWQCPVQGCGKTFFLRATLTKHSRTHTDTRRYVCGTCGKRFLDKQTLDEHGVTHLQIKPFQCHICLKQLTRRSRLRMHLRAHEEELAPALVLVCAACHRAFRDHHHAQEHATTSTECIEAIANELKEEAEEPEAMLSPTSGLVRPTHPVQESPRGGVRSRWRAGAEAGAAAGAEAGAEAEALLARLSDASRPLVRCVRIEKAFRCEYCEDVFYLEDALNSHRVIHKGIKNPFTCHICKVSFATYSRCTTHKTTHGFYKRSLADAKKHKPNTEAGPSANGILGYGGFPVVKHFLCEDCGRSYLHWTYLQVHRRMKHANENLLYKCNHCDLTFPNSWSAAYHRKKNHAKIEAESGNGTIKIAKEDYRIPCRDCEEVLPNKTALYKHRKKEHCDLSLRINSKEGQTFHRCRDDPSASMSSHGISDESSSRGAPRPHVCAVCGHAFRTLSMLNEHTRTHTGERPFPCDVCGVAFRRSTAMRNHRLIHTGERAWRCARCPKRFRIRSDLRTHTRRKHPARTLAVEVSGLNPSPDEVMEILAANNIPHEKVIEITKISFAKGTSNIVPDSYRALSMLSDAPRTQVAWGRTVQFTVEDFQPARRGRGIAKNPRRPKILQREPPPATATAAAYHTGDHHEELTDLNVQYLLRDGVLENGNQMVQLQMDDPMLLQ